MKGRKIPLIYHFVVHTCLTRLHSSQSNQFYLAISAFQMFMSKCFMLKYRLTILFAPLCIVYIYRQKWSKRAILFDLTRKVKLSFSHYSICEAIVLDNVKANITIYFQQSAFSKHYKSNNNVSLKVRSALKSNIMPTRQQMFFLT